jgi:hypothetical protein
MPLPMMLYFMAKYRSYASAAPGDLCCVENYGIGSPMIFALSASRQIADSYVDATIASRAEGRQCFVDRLRRRLAPCNPAPRFRRSVKVPSGPELSTASRGSPAICDCFAFILSSGVDPVHRVIPHIRIEIHLIVIPYRIGLQKPPQRRRVDPRLGLRCQFTKCALDYAPWVVPSRFSRGCGPVPRFRCPSGSRLGLVNWHYQFLQLDFVLSKFNWTYHPNQTSLSG